MITFPNCKINLGLNVVGKRPDGFHDIETVFYPVPLYDVLEIVPAVDGKFAFTSSGIEIPGGTEDNLCMKAYRMLETGYGMPPVAMHLHKVIPMGSGLGGGSADGAFALKMLDELFELNLGTDLLGDLARNLGSDCAFFIQNRPCFACERGDRFSPVTVDLSGLFIAIVIPGLHISTPEAYGMVKPHPPARPLTDLMQLPVEQWKGSVVNDFEDPIVRRFPVIGEIRDQLYRSGAVYASMSGSGSAVYGLFREKPDMGRFGGYFSRLVKA